MTSDSLRGSSVARMTSSTKSALVTVVSFQAVDYDKTSTRARSILGVNATSYRPAGDLCISPIGPGGEELCATRPLNAADETDRDPYTLRLARIASPIVAVEEDFDDR